MSDLVKKQYDSIGKVNIPNNLVGEITKSKTLVEKLAYEASFMTVQGRDAMTRAIEIVTTHQGTEVQRLRDVIARCREALKDCVIQLSEWTDAFHEESDTIIAMQVADEVFSECNAVLENKK